jgi:HEAT repeat protein
MRSRHGLWLAGLLLAACNVDPVERDVSALRTADAAGRKQAAQALAGQRDPRAAKALAFALGDPDKDVRCAAAQALGQQDPAAAVPALTAMLAAHGPGHECAYAPLGQLHDARALGPLLDAARGGKDPAALAAVVAFGPAALGPLLGALRNERDPRHAEELARAVITAGGKDALAPLLAMMGEYDRTANANAATALGLLGDAQAVPALVQAADAGIGPAFRALGRLGQPGLSNLEVRLGSPRPWQRNLALAALAQARDPAVVPLLQHGLQSASPGVADGSALVLSQLAGFAPVPAGTSLDPMLQSAAIAALERAAAQGDTRALVATLDLYLRRSDGEDQLIDLMEMGGDERLAAAFLQSRSEKLRAAASEWTRQTGRKPCAGGAGACAEAVASP